MVFGNLHNYPPPQFPTRSIFLLATVSSSQPMRISGTELSGRLVSSKGAACSVQTRECEVLIQPYWDTNRTKYIERRRPMARATKNNKRKQAQAVKSAAQPAADKSPVTRCDLLTWVGAGVVGVGVFGAGGAWAVSSFNRSVEERDLSRIGQGRPAIVQIHDPQCPVCNALQRETRKALGRVEGDAPIYLIADITQPEGAEFARAHSVLHVMLLLFGGDGTRAQTLTGSRTRSELTPIFVQHSKQ